MKLFAIILAAVLIIGLQIPVLSAASQDSMSFSIQGDHSGSISLMSDGTGTATIDAFPTQSFTWKENDGLASPGHGVFTVYYWWYKIPVTWDVNENSSIVLASSSFPGSIAIQTL